MIVVDTNIIAYLHIPGDRTAQAEQVFAKEPQWAAPLLWRSEFRNVLALYLHKGLMSLDEALRLIAQAERLLEGRECQVSSARILELVAASPCSAYDCEFVALAQELGVPLVTSDQKLLRGFPDSTVSLEHFVA